MEQVEHLKVAGQVVPGGGGGFAEVQVVSGGELQKREIGELIVHLALIPAE